MRFLSLFLFSLYFLSLFLSLSPLVLAGQNYYDILGIRRDAKEKDIKKAYRRLSVQYHPDKNPGDPKAQERFIEIGKAYEVLSDANKRRVYDQAGEEGLKNMNQGGGGRDPGDIFAQFFGGGFGGGGDAQAQERRGEDVIMDLPVELKDLYKGKLIEVLVQNQQLCPHCRGTGARSESDLHVCRVCGGKGFQIRMQPIGPGFMQQVQMPCDHCSGKGKIIHHKCPVCSGKKLVNGKKVLDVYVEAGMNEGSKIEFENAGDENPDHSAGHIVFRIVQIPHPRFERKGNDLHYTMQLSLLEALTGFKRNIEHLDGHSVKVESSEVISHGQVMKMKGEGMPMHNSQSSKGDLYVKFTVSFPGQMTQEQRDGFAAILK